MSPGNDQWLRAGKITGAYGIKGWVKVHSFTDPPENLLDYDAWGLTPPGADGKQEQVPDALRQIKPLAGRMQGKALVAQLQGVADRTAAEGLRGSAIWIAEHVLPGLEDGDYYWRDLLGLRVVTEYEGQTLLLGEVDHLLETGANDVLVLRPCAGSIDERQRLVPYLPEAVVVSVEPHNGDADGPIDQSGPGGRGKGEIRVHWHPED